MIIVRDTTLKGLTADLGRMGSFAWVFLVFLIDGKVLHTSQRRMEQRFSCATDAGSQWLMLMAQNLGCGLQQPGASKQSEL